MTLPKGYYRQSSGIFVVSEAPEAQTSRSFSIPTSAELLLKRYPSAPESLSLLSTESDIADASANLHSAISEEEGSTSLEDSTQFQFLDDRNESLKNSDVADGTSLETDDDMSGHTLESGPPSICSSLSEPSYLTEEMIEKMKLETSSRPGSSAGDVPVGTVREETEERVASEFVEMRDERQKQHGDTEIDGNVETRSPEVKEVIEVSVMRLILCA